MKSACEWTTWTLLENWITILFYIWLSEVFCLFVFSCFVLFFRDLCGEKQTPGALLTKYARSSMQNGIKVFNSRRPVAT